MICSLDNLIYNAFQARVFQSDEEVKSFEEYHNDLD